MITAIAPTLTLDAVTVTTDHMGRVYAVIPDDVARPLAVAARKGIDPEARGYFSQESTAHPADGWVAATVRTIFEALLNSPAVADDDDKWGLGQYRTWGGGTFWGFIVGESGWNADTRWWRDHDHTGDLQVRGNATIAPRSRRHLAGTCTF
ncbi:hypothetical protein [Streptomyces sp. CL12-4]|uniref:hypothetical protein n=1 Tax=Streptomyces sp. CL12-4 TaxID=2810306 RepID=UPI001EFA60D4|nr:hypothetical protein [Streptomyces sp. CL12-4]MCG8971831.1 hypothetical protein [Streptomyces sp. CL12-4]